MAALATRSGWRPGRRRVASKRMRVIERLKAEGLSNREIARRLGVTEKAIRKLVPSEPTGSAGGVAAGGDRSIREVDSDRCAVGDPEVR